MSEGTELKTPGADVKPPELTEPVARAVRLVTEIFSRRSEKLKPKPNAVKGPPRSLYASRIPECARQGVYEFTHWKEKPDWTWELEALFEAGREQEEIFKAQLRKLGLELVHDQTPLSDDMRERYNIGGYIDWKIVFEGESIPTECKMMNVFTFDRIQGLTAKEVLEGKVTAETIEAGLETMRLSPWTRKYLRQLTVYLLGTGNEAGMFALTDGRGRWKFVILPLDYAEGERILAVAEEIKKHVEAGTYPERVDYTLEGCGRCPFANVCVPDIMQDAKLRIIKSPEAAELLEVREAHLESWSKVEKCNRALKKMFKDIKDGTYNIGGFMVDRTEHTRNNKAREASVTTYYKNRYERFEKRDPNEIYIEPKRTFLIDDE